MSERLLGVNHQWQLEWEEHLVEKVATARGNIIREGISWDAVRDNPMMWGYDRFPSMLFKDKMNQVMQWCVKYGVGLMPNLGCFDSWATGDARYPSWVKWKNAMILNENNIQDEWFNALRETTRYFMPKAMCLFNEPEDFEPTQWVGTPYANVTKDQFYAMYDAFIVKCVDAVRSVKPDCICMMNAIPYYDPNRWTVNHPCPRTNVYVGYHRYYALTQDYTWALPSDLLYRDNNLIAGKPLLFQELDDYMLPMLNKGMLVHFEEVGTNLANPNAYTWMRDVYEWCNSRKVGIIQYDLTPYPRDVGGLLTSDWLNLNEMGIVWTEEMQKQAPIINPNFNLTILASAGGTTNPLPQVLPVLANTTTTVTAIPNSGYVLQDWYKDAVSTGISSLSIQVLMDADHSVQPIFSIAPIQTYKLTILGASGGTTNPVSGVLTLNAGSVQPVVPLPASGYRHKSWLFDGVNQDLWWPAGSTIEITMDADHTVQAEFELLPPTEFTLNISSTVGGSTSPPPGAYTQTEGSSVSVSAIANLGYKFNHWTLDGGNAGSTNPISITMNANHTLQAVFAVITFTLAISTTVGGTTTPPPGAYTIQQGLIQQVAATTASGYRFANWLLDGNAKAENPINVTMDTDHTLQAIFAIITYTLTISATAGGTTSPSPSTYTIQEGGSQQVAAIPSPDYSFSNWQLDGVVRTENPITVTMNANRTLLATFQALPPPPPQKQYLTISSVNGRTSPVAGTYEFDKGASVTVTCTPNSGYRFREWLLDNVSAGTVPSYTIIMDVNHGLVAVCEEIPPPPTYTLFISAGNGGTTHPIPGTYQYTQDTIVNVAPIPNSDYRFANWTLDGQVIADSPINVTMNADHSLMAVFEALPPPPPEKQYLTIVAINGQTNPTQGIYQLDTNSVITITATPNSGFRFKEWLLDNVSAGTQPSIVVAMNANHTIVAVSEEKAEPFLTGFPIWTIPATLIVVGVLYLATKRK